jgi:COP9 signalosome complex subunit 12
MDRLIARFEEAYLYGSGPQVAETLAPIPPADDPAFLERICRFSDSLNIVRDINTKILATAPPKVFSKAETNAWAEVYAAYWKAVGVLLQVQDGHRSRLPDLYEAWKEIVLALIKGYSNGHFQSWTIPCLYTVGRYLRTFAIKADEQSRENGSLAFDPNMKEDVASDMNKNDKLEDAARVINRIFTLCISDRCVL